MNKRKRQDTFIKEEEEKLVKGLYVWKEWLNKEKEQELLVQMEREISCSGGWSKELYRETKHFGARYDYKERTLKRDVQDIPQWLRDNVVDRVQTFLHEMWQRDESSKKSKTLKKFDQVIINKYKAGEGISPHMDHIKLFGGIVVTLSLGEQCDIVFTKGNQSVSVCAQRGTLMIFTGEARYEWMHSLKMSKEPNT